MDLLCIVHNTLIDNSLVFNEEIPARLLRFITRMSDSSHTQYIRQWRLMKASDDHEEPRAQYQSDQL